ncbi:MAG: RNB domain-containing ribonuclease [Thermodesulfobacteriota bacterium]
MKIGNVIEYIDRQKIICAVVVDIKAERVHLITESNREVNLSKNRLSHCSSTCLDIGMGRDRLVETLKTLVNRRNDLVKQIDIRELWEVLSPEEEWIDLNTMTSLCFPRYDDGDHEAAVVRAFFQDRFYFKFDHLRFFPFSKEKVEEIRWEAEETERRNRMVEYGKAWIRSVLEQDALSDAAPELQLIRMLKDYYIKEKESETFDLTRTILKECGIESQEAVFKLLVKLGAWNTDQNIDLIRMEIPVDFPEDVLAHAEDLILKSKRERESYPFGNTRKDLTHLPVITIDGQSTFDFDDALSLEVVGDSLRLGVHIADVGEVIEKDTPLDIEARRRGSSIYMPDGKIPMLPSTLAEDLCSLKFGEARPAISIMIMIPPAGGISEFDIFPSIIRVQEQLTYQSANLMASESRQILLMHEIARRFRKIRLEQGAVYITLPEINIRIEEDGKLSMNRTNRESPSRMLISEIMIMANWMMASFLARNGLPAVFRSQPEPKERLFSGNGNLFQNWMQRKFLNRFVLLSQPERHCGLGLDAYVTATSPIRKYYDLTTQRQIRSVFGLETPYSMEEIERMITTLEEPMANVIGIQSRRSRYWLFKYIEKRIGQKEEAIILGKSRNGYHALIPEYMIECRLNAPAAFELKPEDVVRVTIQHVDPRNDILNAFVT